MTESIGGNQWIRLAIRLMRETISGYGWPSDLKEGGHVARVHNSRLAQREALR